MRRIGARRNTRMDDISEQVGFGLPARSASCTRNISREADVKAFAMFAPVCTVCSLAAGSVAKLAGKE